MKVKTEVGWWTFLPASFSNKNICVALLIIFDRWFMQHKFCLCEWRPVAILKSGTNSPKHTHSVSLPFVHTHTQTVPSLYPRRQNPGTFAEICGGGLPLVPYWAAYLIAGAPTPTGLQHSAGILSCLGSDE